MTRLQGRIIATEKENTEKKSPKVETKTAEKSVSNVESIAQNDAQKLNFPFDESKSTDLDAVLSQDKNNTKIDRRASLTGQNNKNTFFNGFFIREEVDKEYVEALKARMDSLKNELKLKQELRK